MKRCRNCNWNNPTSATICEYCGEVLFSEQNKQYKSKLILSDLETEESITISHEGIVGRLGDFNVEYFKRFPFIARVHCKIEYDESYNQWYVRHLNARGTKKVTTMVNGMNLSTNDIHPLGNRDIICLTKRLFSVCVKNTCDVEEVSQPEREEENVIEQGTYVWVIQCPSCCSHHDVADGESRLKNCPHCGEDIEDVEAHHILQR